MDELIYKASAMNWDSSRAEKFEKIDSLITKYFFGQSQHNWSGFRVDQET